MIGYASDITVMGRAGMLAQVRVKNAEELNEESARALMEGEIDSDGRLSPRFVLIVSQNIGFLWAFNNAVTSESKMWTLPMAKLLRPYLRRLPQGAWLRQEELALLIFTWLNALARDELAPPLEEYRSLIDSGFLPALRDENVSLLLPTS